MLLVLHVCRGRLMLVAQTNAHEGNEVEDTALPIGGEEVHHIEEEVILG